MRKNAIFIIFLTMIFMLTDALRRMSARSRNPKRRGGARKRTRLQERTNHCDPQAPSHAGTYPEVTPEPTAEPKPEPETTEEIPQESLAPNESAESSLNQPVTETADHSGGQKYCYLALTTALPRTPRRF